MASAIDDTEERQLLVDNRPEKTATVVTMELDSCSSARSSTLDIDENDDNDSLGGGAVPKRLPLDNAAAESEVVTSEDDVDNQLHQMRFKELLRRSQEEDLSSMENTNCIYRAGYDKQGRAVIVFVGKWFKQSQVDLEKALLYLLKTVDPIAGHDYIVIYFHTRTSRDNIPSYWWIKEVYSALPYKYKKHLKSFYVVHPTMWTKMTTWWFSTFMAPAIKNKIHNVNALVELGPVVDEQELSLPMFITEQDMVFNGIRYYQP